MAQTSLCALERDELRQSFLRAHGKPDDLALTFLAGDCSFRTYFRLQTTQSWFAPQVVLMDAPPPEENIVPFLKIGEILARAGLRSPRVYAFDVENGFMLLEDFGNTTYRRALLQGADQKTLYRESVNALLKIQKIPPQEDIPCFGNEELLKEMGSFFHWAMEAPLCDGRKAEALSLWRQCLYPLEEIRAQQPVLALRDYHVENLMVLSARGSDTCGTDSCGLLDFQDAGWGTQAYDLVSLLQDARIDVGESFEREMKEHYFQQQGNVFEKELFEIAYTLLGLQRASKILGIFLRRARRDKKIEILEHIPRVCHAIQRGLDSPLTANLRPWFQEMFSKGLPHA